MSQLSSTISHFWNTIQASLFPWMQEELLPLTEQQKKFVAILEMIRIEEFIPRMDRWMGRPTASRKAIARAFVAKSFYNLFTTRALHQRLETDVNLRRICGWESRKDIPSEATFSRAFKEFSDSQLPKKVHEALIKVCYKDELIGHMSRDSTAIEGREKPKYIKKSEEAIEATKLNDQDVESSLNSEKLPLKNPSKKKPKKKRGRGRPKKGEEIEIKDLSRIQRQAGGGMSLEEMIKDLPVLCNKGAKKNSKGFAEIWTGYKLHLDISDNGVPISAIITSASLHDSQVAIPLAALSSTRVVNLYDLMDSAYDVKEIKEYSIKLNHVPIIDINPRRDAELKKNLEKENKARHTLNWEPAEAIRYNHRSTAERSNARLKDEFGGRNIRVRGAKKVFCHLMIGVLVLSADHLLRLAS